MKKTRTRFAPSPTGHMHIGNLRTAIYAYLIAKKDKGTFVLRIEDTDRSRYVEGAEKVIYDTLKDTGLIYDEGPEIGGDYGPYIQSQREQSYIIYAKKLIEDKKAYYCFCQKDRLDALRKESEDKNIAYRYDKHCLNLSSEEIQSKLDNKEAFVIRQNMPETGSTTYTDLVYGDITIENSELEDQILIKSDGMPTYNFANVVDDHEMNITHIVRGNEYLVSTPKYNLLYEAFGWDVPKYIHVPLIVKEGGKKLSKRDGDAVYYNDLIELGYLKDTIINYICLLGWSAGGEREKFTLSELVENFSIKGISKSPAVFDINKLNWLNGEYIRAMSLDEFYSHAKPYIDMAVKSDIDKKKLCALLQDRTEKLSDIPEKLDFIDKIPDYDPDLFIHKKMKTTYEIAKDNLQKLVPYLENLDIWNQDTIHEACFKLIEDIGVKNGLVLYPFRVAVTGKQVTPGGAMEISEILGKKETIDRIHYAIEKLS